MLDPVMDDLIAFRVPGLQPLVYKFAQITLFGLSLGDFIIRKVVVLKIELKVAFLGPDPPAASP